MRWLAGLLGLAAAVLWVVAVALDAPTWLAWLDAVVALCSGATAAIVPGGPMAGLATAAALTFLGGGLATMWIVAVRTGAPGWLLWCNFGLAAVYLVAAVAAGGYALASGALWLVLRRAR